MPKNDPDRKEPEPSHGSEGGTPPSVQWLDAPEQHDYPAAAAYLSLLATSEQISAILAALEAAATVTNAAKDVLRAARLPLLEPDNVHVAADLDKIRHGHPLSPVLVVRGDLGTGRAAQIADGYHRVCASYHTDENTPIPLRIVDAIAPRPYGA